MDRKISAKTKIPGKELFLFSIARKFIQLPPGAIDKEINSCLGHIAQLTSTDRCYIYLFQKKHTKIELIYDFRIKGVKEKIIRHDQVKSDDFSWLLKPIMDHKTIAISSIKEISDNSGTIKAIMEVEKTKSMFLCPLISHGVVVGFIGLDTVAETREWPDETEYLLKNSADIFVRAITRKKISELEKRTEQKLRSLFRRTSEAVFISTPDGKILEINPAGIKLLGYNSMREIKQLDIEKDVYLKTDDREQLKEILQEKGQVKDYESTLKRKDGKIITVLETITAVKDTNGKVIAYEGIMRDVTDKRQLEQQLFQAQKMESIGLLAGGIAHDFNNILTAIDGYAQMVLMKLDPANSHYKYVMNIHKGSKRAGKLVRQLLGFSRKQMIAPKVLNINNVIDDLLKMLNRLIAENIRFETRLKEGLSLIKADPVQLQQILVNLVINASHAIGQLEDPSIPRIIRITTEEINITSNFVALHPGSKTGKHVVISVRDTGVGMDEETKQKVFDPFFTTKKQGDGTGLGLSTVYGIMKQNNGSVYVSSNPGKGTAFKIYWPVTKETKHIDTDTDSDISFEKRSETILVVEDDFDVRDLATTALTSFGYTVFEAENGQKALELIKEQNLADKIDLLLTDVVMPEMGGQELAKKIQKINPGIKIILSSGYTDSQILKNEDNNNGYFFLPKPYSIKGMDKKITTVLST